MNEIKGKISTPVTIRGVISTPQRIVGKVTAPEIITPPEYQGDYEVTPSSEIQILLTDEKYLTDNIIVNAIPSNYGLITWDGSIITVS